jgi:hypothetical protein
MASSAEGLEHTQQESRVEHVGALNLVLLDFSEEVTPF